MRFWATPVEDINESAMNAKKNLINFIFFLI